VETGGQMKILETKDGVVVEAEVKTRSRNFEIQTNKKLVIFCRQPPVKGKANQELTKELSKIFRRKVEIVAGFRSKAKKILIKDITEDEAMEKLENLRKEQ
jgi:hypothetical protein